MRKAVSYGHNIAAADAYLCFLIDSAIVPFINIHSHRRPSSPREWVIRNGGLPPAGSRFPERPGYFVSVGLHPWRADRYSETRIAERLSHLLADASVLAVGEIGLDRVNGPDFSIQKKVFRQQWEMAEQHRKPVVVHCVKAYSDVLAYAKDVTVPFILHDYSGNAQTTEHLLRFPGIYFSFGRLLYRNPQNATERLRQIPAGRIFFETDTRPLPISSVYSLAAQYLQADTETWVRQVWDNFVRISAR